MKYVSAAIAFILFIIVAIVGVRLVRNQIKNLNNNTTAISQLELSEFKKSGVKLRFKVSGPVVADEDHRELVFEVGQGTRSLKVMKGYNQTLLKEQQLANNFNAYDAFATALYSTGFMNERVTTKKANNQGECPQGNVYTAELLDSEGKVKKSLWRISCNTKSGNMSGSPTTILGLFQKQFPEYRSFANDITID